MILLTGTNDLLKGISIDNYINFMKNIEHMVPKGLGFGVKRVLLSGIANTKSIP